MPKEQGITVKGEVLEQFAGEKFAIRLENGKEVRGYLGGKLRKNMIRVIPGDIVDIEFSPYDLTNAKIVFRYKK